MVPQSDHMRLHSGCETIPENPELNLNSGEVT
jgi:hypothetical protein